MRVGVIGRTEILYEAVHLLKKYGHEIVFIVTAKEAPEYTRTSDDFRQLSKNIRAPFAHSAKIADQIALIESAKPDIAISLNYVGVVPQSIIDLFPYGVLNAHGGDLPRYRGNACQAWAILNGEDHIGLCIHKMVGDELDTGDIITREYLPIDHTTKVTKVWSWISDRAPELFLQALELLSENPNYVLEKQSVDPREILRCYPRRPEDGRVDWSQSALNVLRLINANNKPYAGAYCEYEGQKMIIWDAELVNDSENFCATPGQVVHIAENCIEVACGIGKLLLHEVAISGNANSPTIWIKSIRKRLS